MTNVNNTNMKKCARKKFRNMFLEAFSSHSRAFDFLTKFLSLLCMRSLDYQNFSLSFCKSKSNITMCNLHWCYTFCTGVTLFALVLHSNCTRLSTNQNRVIFSCVLLSVKTYQNAQRNYLLSGEQIYDQSETTLRETEQTQVRVI